MNPLFEELLAQAPGQTPVMPAAPTVASTGGATDVVQPQAQSMSQSLLAPMMFPGRALMGEAQVFDPNGHVTPEATDWGTSTAMGLAGASSVPHALTSEQIKKLIADQYGTAMQMMLRRGHPNETPAGNGGLGGLGGFAPRA